MFSVIPILWINPTGRALFREPGRLAQTLFVSNRISGREVSKQQITQTNESVIIGCCFGEQITQNGDMSFFQRLVPNQFFRWRKRGLLGIGDWVARHAGTDLALVAHFGRSTSPKSHHDPILCISGRGQGCM
jgi:hypothetical protein